MIPPELKCLSKKKNLIESNLLLSVLTGTCRKQQEVHKIIQDSCKGTNGCLKERGHFISFLQVKNEMIHSKC